MLSMQSKSVRSAVLGFATLGVVGLSVSSAGAATTIYSAGGFESPYTTTNLVGQSGGGAGAWVSVNSGPNGSSTGTVTTAQAASGTQSAYVTRTGNVNKRYFYTETSGTNPLPGGTYDMSSSRYVFISWNQYTQSGAGVDGNGLGPFFGVESYASTGNPLDASPQRFQGSLGMDAGTGEVLYYDGFYQVGPTLAFNTWHSFQMTVDYLTKKYQVVINGSVFTDGASNQWFDFYDTGTYQYWGDADLTTTATSIFGSLQTGGAYFDNLLVTTSPTIPEPTSLLVLGGSAVTILARRRSR